VSQADTGQAHVAELSTQETATFIRQVRDQDPQEVLPGRQDPHRSGRVPKGGHG